MGIDIAIPLKRDRFTNYYELRMTLRSIEQNLTGYRNIYIIGEKPGWITNVTHIPCTDIYHRKAFSIFRKMLTAAKNQDVSQNFISWADDTYLLQPFHTSEIKDWYDGTLKEWTCKNINSLYRQIIKNTWNLFPDGLFYNVHTPCIYEKHRFIEMKKYDWSVTQLLIKSTYFNSGSSNPEPMKDPKRHPGLFYSTSDKLKPEDHQLFKTHLPNPSRYEADNKTNGKATCSMAKAAR